MEFVAFVKLKKTNVPSPKTNMRHKSQQKVICTLILAEFPLQTLSEILLHCMHKDAQHTSHVARKGWFAPPDVLLCDFLNDLMHLFPLTFHIHNQMELRTTTV